MEFLVYSANLVMGFQILRTRPWVYPSRLWWVDTPTKNLETDAAFFALMYAARYVTFLFVVLTETRKKDFVEMVVHHLVTVVLIVVSYVGGFARVGLVIMVLFDIADPLLHAAKMANYNKKSARGARRKLFGTAADVLFGSFAVVFFATRIVVYSWVVYSVSVESIAMPYATGVRPTDTMCAWPSCGPCTRCSGSGSGC